MAVHDLDPEAVSANLGVAVSNIQRCSVHDGPGVRTTVFLR